MSTSSPWVCYLIWNKERKRTYVGITNNLTRRLHAHNTNRGARSTKGPGTWIVVCHLSGFPDHRTVLQFEKKWHMMRRNNSHLGRGIPEDKWYAYIQPINLARSLNQLWVMLHLPKWTKKCIPSNQVHLVLYWSNNGEGCGRFLFRSREPNKYNYEISCPCCDSKQEEEEKCPPLGLKKETIGGSP